MQHLIHWEWTGHCKAYTRGPCHLLVLLNTVLLSIPNRKHSLANAQLCKSDILIFCVLVVHDTANRLTLLVGWFEFIYIFLNSQNLCFWIVTSWSDSNRKLHYNKCLENGATRTFMKSIEWGWSKMLQTLALKQWPNNLDKFALLKFSYPSPDSSYSHRQDSCPSHHTHTPICSQRLKLLLQLMIKIIIYVDIAIFRQEGKYFL